MPLQFLQSGVLKCYAPAVIDPCFVRLELLFQGQIIATVNNSFEYRDTPYRQNLKR